MSATAVTRGGPAIGHATIGHAAIGHLLGAAEAPHRLVVYATYECLHCRRAWPTLRALAESSDGRLAVEWRHFAPPGAFPQAGAVAALAESAGLQGAFWAMHEALLAAPAPLPPGTPTLIADALGLDGARLRADAVGDPVRARLDAQAADATARAVRGTPTLVLDGAVLPRTWDLDEVSAAVRDAIGAGERGAGAPAAPAPGLS